MTITRGSHLLTSISLPDASFALFLIGGILLKKPKWFISFFIFSVLIDLVTLSLNNNYHIPINLGYLGLLPSYGLMWFFGSRVTNTKSFINFTMLSLLAILIAFLISTQTYNLFSGTFPGITIKESILAGWEYLPQSLIYTMSYLMAYWGIQLLFKRQFVSQKATAL
jgi:phosphate starvation-inducible membrane PsiE